MKIRLHVPSRHRPSQMAFAVEQAILRAEAQRASLSVSFALDEEDPVLHKYQRVIQGIERDFPHVRCTKVALPGRGKVAACNALTRGEWDVLVLLSDDMVCVTDAWDVVISDALSGDPRGCARPAALWFPDGNQDVLCTLSIMTRPLYDAFGYVYHPDYKSLWCDNEYHDTCEHLGVLLRQERVLFKHRHWVSGEAAVDDLYQHNDALWDEDEATYKRRKASGFDIARVTEALRVHTV